MRKTFVPGITCGIVLSLGVLSIIAHGQPARGPVELRVDNLKNPLGIDDTAPRFSWQLRDSAPGARQTAYEVKVASTAAQLTQGKAQAWTSGRVDSSQSMNIVYKGPALVPSKRYYWQVKVWDAGGKEYPASQAGWWETGLMRQSDWHAPRDWHAAWIGYETPEEAAVRHAPAEWIANPEFKELAKEKATEQHFAYRGKTNLDKPVRSAALYAACQNTVSAWVNGTQVLLADPLPPYKQMPWKKYVRANVTRQLTSGANSVVLDCVHYVVNPNGMATNEAPPLSATLYVEFTDGSSTT